jgi:nitrate reductase NapE
MVEPPIMQRTAGNSRRRELTTFAILAFGIWPIIAVGVVGGYGFLVWMYQIVFGPPGPPSTGLH